MTDTKENIMGTLPIGKLLMKMSVPVILSMLVSTLYGVIDSIFVSRLGDNMLADLTLIVQSLESMTVQQVRIIEHAMQVRMLFINVDCQQKLVLIVQ